MCGGCVLATGLSDFAAVLNQRAVFRDCTLAAVRKNQRAAVDAHGRVVESRAAAGDQRAVLKQKQIVRARGVAHVKSVLQSGGNAKRSSAQRKAGRAVLLIGEQTKPVLRGQRTLSRQEKRGRTELFHTAFKSRWE